MCSNSPAVTGSEGGGAVFLRKGECMAKWLPDDCFSTMDLLPTPPYTHTPTTHRRTCSMVGQKLRGGRRGPTKSSLVQGCTEVVR